MHIEIKKERLHYIDAIKSILIMLVILGHAIQFTLPNYQHEFLFRFIYSFHMPLFFLVSGFLTFKEKYDDLLIKKRGIQLLIPFITWAFILPLLETSKFDIERTLRILLYPDNGLWFLYNLFVYCMIFNLSERWSSKKFKQEYLLVGFIILLFIVMELLHTLLNVSQICWYSPFFAMGYYVRKYSNYLLKHENLICIFWGGIYLMTMPFWMMREDPLFYQWINLGNIFSYLYRYLVEITGALFFFIIGKKSLNHPPFVIKDIGTKTLGIYAFQFIVLFYLGKILKLENRYFKIYAEASICIPLCYALVYIIHKLKYVRLFLIGDK